MCSSSMPWLTRESPIASQPSSRASPFRYSGNRPLTYQPSTPGGWGRRRSGAGSRGSRTANHTASASANVAAPIQSGCRPRTRGGSGKRGTSARSELEVEEGTGGGAADDEEQRQHQAGEHGARQG